MNNFNRDIQTLYPFFDSLNAFIFIFSTKGEIKYVNKALLEFLDVKFEDLFDNDIKNLIINHLDELKISDLVHLKHVKTERVLKIPIKYIEKFDDLQLIQFYPDANCFKQNLSIKIMNSTNIMFLYIDRDKKILAFNEAINAYSKSLYQHPILIGDLAENYLPAPEDQTIFNENFKKAIKGERSVFTKYYPNLAELGIWFEYEYNPILNDRNEIEAVSLIARDVSKENRLAEQLKKSEVVFRNMFENIHDPAILWHKETSGRVILKQYNRASDQISKGTMQRWLGCELKEFYQNREDILHMVHQTFANGKSTRKELRYQLVTTGEAKWVLADFVYINENCVLFIITDISERKRIEIETQENERRLSTLLDNLPGMAYRCINDRDWTMKFVSEGCMPLTGYEPEDLLENRLLAYNDLVHPDDQDRVWDEIQEAIHKKEKFEISYRLITKDKETKWVWERGQGIFNDQSQLAALEGFITDITQRVKHEHEAIQARYQAEALREALTEITAQISLPQVLRKILDSLKKVLPYDRATLFLRQKGKIQIVAARGFENTGLLIDRTFSNKIDMVKAIDESHRPVILEDASLHEGYKLWSNYHTKSWMGVPLIRNQVTIGYLTIDYHKAGFYKEKDAKTAQLFANGAAIVIENAKLYEKSIKLAMVDALTSIYNRRHFYEMAQAEFKRCKRYRNNLSVIMLDIDHFKYINDKYGHQSGDQILIQFVKRVEQELRNSDIFARYGGEEFIILLPETDAEQAMQVAERIRVVTAEKPFVLEDAQPYITISLGVSALDETCENLDMLIDQSDKALYEAKNIGRNRVRLWKDE